VNASMQSRTTQGAQVRETLVQFGPERRLVGVLSGDPAASQAPVLVLPNAGLVPRAGPFRLHVELAQRLARRGVCTFRFDAPGVGEASRIRGCSAHDATIAALDVLAAQHGARRFVVGGVCSAADLGWSTALRDQRVCGMLMLDGISFTGPWFRLAKIANVLERSPREWPGILWRMFGRAAKGGGDGAPAIAEYREWPDRKGAQRQFAGLVARGLRSLWIYTGGYCRLFRHPRQFTWALGPATRDPRVEMHYWSDCDHTFYARAHRNRLMDTIERWMAAHADEAGAAA
jgi:hypothetical protein